MKNEPNENLSKVEESEYQLKGGSFRDIVSLLLLIND